MTAVFAAVAQAAPPSQTWQSGNNCGEQEKIRQRECGTSAGELVAPVGVAVDPSTGNIYVGDTINARISEFTPWGVFRKAWGWGVVNGAAGAQTCGPAATPPTATCRHGVAGGGAGQFTGTVSGLTALSDVRGITLDASGNLYVYEAKGCLGGTACVAAPHANRVQKFSPSGDFLLVFGRRVNLTQVALREAQEANAEPVTVTLQQENLCTAASGNQCGPGLQGSGPGEFNAGALAPIDTGSGVISSGPSGTIYVGGQERVQKFNTAGEYLGSVSLPGKMVRALAADSLGNMYLAFSKVSNEQAEPNVLKIDPGGSPLCTSEVPAPQAVAVSASDIVAVTALVGSSAEIRQFTSTCAAIEPGTGAGANVLSASSTGLAASNACGIPGTEFVASNGALSNSFIAAFGPPPDATACPPPTVPPSIADQYAIAASSSSVTVKARINPHFWPDTRYYVEYGTSPCAVDTCASEPVPPGTLLTTETTNDELLTTGVTLRNLSAGTNYHYRFVATSGGGGPVFGLDPDGSGPEEATAAAGVEATFRAFPQPPGAKTDCANQGFRIGRSARLPNCRAYEMVSSVDKNNSDIAGNLRSSGGLLKVSSDGLRATFQAPRASAEPEGAPFAVQFFATRDTSSGWSTRAISARRNSLSMYQPGTTNLGYLFRSFSEDLCQAQMVQDVDIALAPGAPAGVPNLYRRSNCGDQTAPYALLTSAPPPEFGPDGDQFVEYFPLSQGESTDGTRTVFRANAALTPDACASPSKDIFHVYESTPSGLRLVSRLNENPGGAEPPCVHASAGTAQGAEGAISEDSVHNAVSADGARVYWTASTHAGTNQIPPGSGGGSGDQRGHLFLRVNSDQEQSALSKAGKCVEPEKACTYQVSELVSPQPARFLTADPSGARALFSMDPDGNGPGSVGLYEFEASGEGALATKATLITGGLVGFMGASTDLDRQYVAATGAVPGSGANGQGAEAVAGQPNLYLYEPGDGFQFMATLAQGDVLDPNASTTNAPPSPLSVRPFLRTSRVSESGLQAVFTSAAELTKAENADVESGRADTQVFLFDASEGTSPGDLICVSCNLSGVRPSGRKIAEQSNGAVQLWAAGRLPGWTEELHPSRVLSESGERVFFESFDPLVPRDTNSANDVYEWERADGEEDCLKGIGGELYDPQGGCLSLISSGQDQYESFFIDADESGASAFISTRASLVQQDPGLADLYVAREGGGFPPPPPPAPVCEGIGCQNPPQPPSDSAPGSTTFNGPGNPKQPSKCPEGKHKVKDKKTGKTRCVKKKKQKGKAGSSGRAHR